MLGNLTNVGINHTEDIFKHSRNGQSYP